MPPGPAFKNKPASGSTVAFKSDGTDVVFARVAALVRGSTELHGCTVRAWDDPSVDHGPPSTDGPPWILLTPSPGPSRIYCRTPLGVVHRMPMAVAIETSVGGSDVAQSQKLWGAILRAIFPGRILDAQLQLLGVSRIAVEQPAWGASGKDSARCEATGRIVLDMSFTTTE